MNDIICEEEFFEVNKGKLVSRPELKIRLHEHLVTLEPHLRTKHTLRT